MVSGRATAAQDGRSRIFSSKRRGSGKEIPAIGKVLVKLEGDALVMAFAASGAKLRLDPWDGDVFTATLVPEGRFAAVAANEGPGPVGFVQFQIDNNGQLNRLRMTDTNGQQFEFLRE
jgi:hypothetical protein